MVASRVHVIVVTSCHRAEQINKYDQQQWMSLFIVWCCVTASDMAPGGVNKETGRGATAAYLGWAQPHHHQCHCCIVAGAQWQWYMGCVDNGGGGKEEATWQCLSHSCHI